MTARGSAKPSVSASPPFRLGRSQRKMMTLSESTTADPAVQVEGIDSAESFFRPALQVRAPY